ncbi:CRISPR-associated primase-polymerase type B [Agriterribacter sp.]|uniref:CRISPR-associated primase-polymerase type B n=1 Tax=Agriterribacter sp. TaxID=2821509 RepID=UPI002C981596|nr:CRISPR-associated primase-polymerase type B [Agriterribacter sp.]HRP56370.1 CRISPR-associated primase-polymerase type B [Agriterribacter sp.]
MLTFGLNIQAPGDPLQKTTVAAVAGKIMHPSPAFASRIQQLRQVQIIDEKQYRRQKATLPYFCCGIFNPPVRRKENFAALHYFTLDFDHFSEAGLSKATAFEKLSAIPQVQLLFTTPGGDGLKVLFRLSERCIDAGLYTHFYKAFATHIAIQCGLQKAIDAVTHDVTRAVFFSADPEAYYNENALAVNMRDYISEDTGTAFMEVETAFDALVKDTATVAGKISRVPQEDSIALIRQKLNPGYLPKKQKTIVEPEEVNSILETIETELNKNDIQLKASRPIHYGRQLTVQMMQYSAELNVFYGKKGFTVVRTTKTGTNAELADLAWQVLDAFL